MCVFFFFLRQSYTITAAAFQLCHIIITPIRPTCDIIRLVTYIHITKTAPRLAPVRGRSSFESRENNRTWPDISYLADDWRSKIVFVILISVHYESVRNFLFLCFVFPFSKLDNNLFLLNQDYTYITGKLCHRGKCHSGNCHSGERWMSRPFVHSGNLNFKHTLTNNLVFHNAWKRIICHFIT